MNPIFDDKAIILFQGDSITDCDRDYQRADSMGDGYPAKISAIYHALFDQNVTFINKGVSGDRCRNLLERYEKDILAVKPDYLSILIGINDTWRRYDSNDPTSGEQFEKEYRELLTKVRKDLPQTKLILMEPFLLYTRPEEYGWREDLYEKADAVPRLAKEFGALYVPLQGMFDQLVCGGAAPVDLSEDGVHPTSLGHSHMAMAWLRAIGVL